MDQHKKRDEIFKDPNQLGDFRFDERVAGVFDDMITRSVPGYAQIQQMITDLAVFFATPGSKVCDLGCSTGNTLRALDAALPDGVSLYGCDGSAPMLALCQKKLAAPPVRRPLELQQCDLNQSVELGNASVVVMCLVLQFIRAEDRPALLGNIQKQLNNGGALLLVEKIKASDDDLDRIYSVWHESFKRVRGYSDLEISRKKQALEDVLVPYSMADNLRLLSEAGFIKVDVFFRWGNFCGIVALKN